MKRYYSSLSENRRIIFLTTIVAICGIILMTPLFFFNYLSIPVGWLWGNLFGIIGFLLIVRQTDVMIQNQAKKAYVIYFISRILIYFVALATALTLSHYDIHVLNIIAVLIGLLVNKIIVVVIGRRCVT